MCFLKKSKRSPSKTKDLFCRHNAGMVHFLLWKNCIKQDTDRFWSRPGTRHRHCPRPATTLGRNGDQGVKANRCSLFIASGLP